MWSQSYKTAGLALLVFFCIAYCASAGQHKQKQNQPKHEKTVWNYDGGVFFQTDGSLPNGVCFRVYGRVTSEDFFNNLKRVDTDEGTIFRRGAQLVTQFPDTLVAVYAIRDQLCPSNLQQVGTRAYMTQEMLESLRLSIYWKHGVDLHPVKNIKLLDARVDRINPYATALAAELPRRYEWSYELSVPSEGVSLSDSLVFIFRTPDQRIAARVAARM
jgi:hypothetical protein